jgi:excinuclease ABC subunit C
VAYQQQVDDVTKFLRGRRDELVDDLTVRMNARAEALQFEAAARIRDQIVAIENTLERQHVVADTVIDQDIFGFHREGDAIDIVILTVRSGLLVGRQPFSFDGQPFPEQELLSSFLTQYYDQGKSIPAQILLPFSLEDEPTTREWLTELRGSPVQILTPLKGDKVRLLELAEQNARAQFAMRRDRREELSVTLEKIREQLRLKRLPLHIECFDISSLQGQMAVAAMTVMVDGTLDKSKYRKFRIALPDRASRPGAYADDFSALYEALSRRFRRAREGSKGWELPDLIVIDGGKGQLAVAMAALRDVGIEESAAPDLIALAKERPLDGDTTETKPDRIFIPHVKEAIQLRPNTRELFLLAQLRDEAHRFAITYHKTLRRRRGLRSGLDDIPGLGPKRKNALLRALGSLKNIREASTEDLMKVKGMTLRAAESVVKYFAEAAPAESTSPDTEN